MNVLAVDYTPSIITASLTNGSSLQAHFTGGTPPVLASLTPQLSLAAGATFTWTVQALVLFAGNPAPGQSIAWSPPTGSGINTLGASAILTNTSGIATATLTVGPLAEGQTATISACLNGTGQCVVYTAFGSRPEYGSLVPVSGVIQTLAVSATPAAVTLRLLDMSGNPMAGGTVAFYQALYAWQSPCAQHTVCPPSTLLASRSSTCHHCNRRHRRLFARLRSRHIHQPHRSRSQRQHRDHLSSHRATPRASQQPGASHLGTEAKGDLNARSGAPSLPAFLQGWARSSPNPKAPHPPITPKKKGSRRSPMGIAKFIDAGIALKGAETLAAAILLKRGRALAPSNQPSLNN